MTQVYRHTQFGTVIVAGIAFGLALSVFSLVFVLPPSVALTAVSVGPPALCLLLFPTLTTEVDSERVRCFFGFGLIQRVIALGQIEHVTRIRNSWTHGWGIRLLSGGWLWNVSGLDAVELTLRNGRRFRIGTDQPEALVRALQAYVPARAAPESDSLT